MFKRKYRYLVVYFFKDKRENVHIGNAIVKGRKINAQSFTQLIKDFREYLVKEHREDCEINVSILNIMKI